MTTIFIDVPSEPVSGYQYNFNLHKNCADVLRIQEKIQGKVTFICNSLGGFSDGDVYRIEFDDEMSEGDILFFMLKTGFKILDPEIVHELKKYVTKLRTFIPTRRVRA